MAWHTEGRRLKNKVTDPNEVQNPEFPFAGLYSIHATLKLNVSSDPVPFEGKELPQPVRKNFALNPWGITAPGKTVLLQSNEQLVSIGGSRELPKFSYGQLQSADPATKRASLNLGSLHKIERSDEFQIRTGMREFWKLTITEIFPEFSRGQLQPLLQLGQNPMEPDPQFPDRFANAALIMKNDVLETTPEERR